MAANRTNRTALLFLYLVSAIVKLHLFRVRELPQRLEPMSVEMSTEVFHTMLRDFSSCFFYQKVILMSVFFSHDTVDGVIEGKTVLIVV